MLGRVCHFGPVLVLGIKYLQKGRKVAFITYFSLTLIKGKSEEISFANGRHIVIQSYCAYSQGEQFGRFLLGKMSLRESLGECHWSQLTYSPRYSLRDFFPLKKGLGILLGKKSLRESLGEYARCN